MLQRLAGLIDEHREELALLETLDMGKPITKSRTVDLPAAIDAINYYAEAIDKIYDEVVPSGPDDVVTVVREPLGVVGAVVPWNYPLVSATWKLGPALAAGNSVVLKPAEQSPLSALRLAELAAEAGLPDGVLQVVPRIWRDGWPGDRSCIPTSTWSRSRARPRWASCSCATRASRT